MAGSLKCPWGVKEQFTGPFKELVHYRSHGGSDSSTKIVREPLVVTRYLCCSEVRLNMGEAGVDRGSIPIKLTVDSQTAPRHHVVQNLAASHFSSTSLGEKAINLKWKYPPGFTRSKGQTAAAVSFTSTAF